MDKYVLTFLGVTLIIISTNIAVIDSVMTLKQIEVAGKMIRQSCQPLFDISDEIIDGMKKGEFPENDALKCYVNCMLEMSLIMRNGVPNIASVMKQIKTVLPEELREPYLNGMEACKNAADDVEGKCQVAYELIKCTHRSNPVFLWP